MYFIFVWIVDVYLHADEPDTGDNAPSTDVCSEGHLLGLNKCFAPHTHTSLCGDLFLNFPNQNEHAQHCLRRCISNSLVRDETHNPLQYLDLPTFKGAGSTGDVSAHSVQAANPLLLAPGGELQAESEKMILPLTHASTSECEDGQLALVIVGDVAQSPYTLGEKGSDCAEDAVPSMRTPTASTHPLSDAHVEAQQRISLRSAQDACVAEQPETRWSLRNSDVGRRAPLRQTSGGEDLLDMPYEHGATSACYTHDSDSRRLLKQQADQLGIDPPYPTGVPLLHWMAGSRARQDSGPASRASPEDFSRTHTASRSFDFTHDRNSLRAMQAQHREYGNDPPCPTGVPVSHWTGSKRVGHAGKGRHEKGENACLSLRAYSDSIGSGQGVPALELPHPVWRNSQGNDGATPDDAERDSRRNETLPSGGPRFGRARRLRASVPATNRSLRSPELSTKGRSAHRDGLAVQELEVSSQRNTRLNHRCDRPASARQVMYAFANSICIPGRLGWAQETIRSLFPVSVDVITLKLAAGNTRYQACGALSTKHVFNHVTFPFLVYRTKSMLLKATYQHRSTKNPKTESEIQAIGVSGCFSVIFRHFQLW